MACVPYGEEEERLRGEEAIGRVACIPYGEGEGRLHEEEDGGVYGKGFRLSGELAGSLQGKEVLRLKKQEADGQANEEVGSCNKADVVGLSGDKMYSPSSADVGSLCNKEVASSAGGVLNKNKGPRESPARSRSSSPAPRTFEKEKSPFLQVKTRLKPVTKPSTNEPEWKRVGLLLKPRKTPLAFNQPGVKQQLVIYICVMCTIFKCSTQQAHRVEITLTSL